MQNIHKHIRFQSITKFTDWLAFFWGIIFTLFCSLAAFRENLGGIFNNRLPLAGDGSFTAIFLKLLKERLIVQKQEKNLRTIELLHTQELEENEDNLDEILIEELSKI